MTLQEIFHYIDNDTHPLSVGLEYLLEFISKNELIESYPELSNLLVHELSGYQNLGNNNEIRESIPSYRKLAGEFIGKTRETMEASSFFGATLITPNVETVKIQKPSIISEVEFLKMRQTIFVGPLKVYEGMLKEHKSHLEDPDYFLYSSPNGEPVDKLKQGGKYTSIELRLHPSKISDMLASIKNEVIISSKSIRVNGKKDVSSSAGKIANEVVSLKPNIFGIGVDINAVIDKINQWISSKG